MSTLNVLMTHLPAVEVDEQLGLLRQVAPESCFVVAYAGGRSEFELIGDPHKALLVDPSLSGPPRCFQSYNVALAVICEQWLRPTATLDSVYLFEFDHLILRPDFEAALRGLAAKTGAGLMGKTCVQRNAVNWHHYTRFRNDAALLEHLARLTVRDDPTRMYGTLGSGMWLTRAAVESYVGTGEHPRCYGELYVPTLLHHLGYELVDIDAHGSLYEQVRWKPEYNAAEIVELRRQRATFAHPVKDATLRRAALERAAAGP